MNNIETTVDNMSLDDIIVVLDEHIKERGLPTRTARREKRLNSTFEELQRFYSAVMPFMPRIIEQLNEYPLKEIPAKYKGLIYTTFSLMDADNPVNKYKGAAPIQDVSDLRGAVPKRSYQDRRLPYDTNREWLNEVNRCDDSEGIILT